MTRKLTVICLVRHGETVWNLEGRMQGRENVPMNETGRAQARACAAAFAAAKEKHGIIWDSVFASPLDRAVETGTFIAHALGLPDPEKTSHLNERDFGKYSGLSYYDYAVATHSEDFDRSQLESEESMKERIYAFARQIHEAAPGSRVIGVTHGGVVKTLGKIEEKAPGVEYYEGAHNCCINVYTFDGEKLLLWAFNLKGEEYVTACAEIFEKIGSADAV